MKRPVHETTRPVLHRSQPKCLLFETDPADTVKICCLTPISEERLAMNPTDPNNEFLYDVEKYAITPDFFKSVDLGSSTFRVASLKRTPKRIPEREKEAPLPHK